MLKKQALVDPEILLYAFRYALPRHSHATLAVIDTVSKNIDVLPDAHIETMIREINEHETFGLKRDEAHWLNLIHTLKQEQTKRGA